MKDSSTPILAGLQNHIGSWRLVTYLQERDEHRIGLAIPRTPRWMDTTLAMAAEVYGIHKSSLLHASHSLKLIWDKGNR